MASPSVQFPPPHPSPTVPPSPNFSRSLLHIKRLGAADVVTCQTRSWSGAGRTVVTGHQALVTDKWDPPSPWTTLFVQLRAPLYSGEWNTHLHTHTPVKTTYNTSQKLNISVINQRLIVDQLSPVGGVSRFHSVLSMCLYFVPNHLE